MAQASYMEETTKESLIKESIKAYHKALEVYTPKFIPTEWAKTHCNLASAILVQAVETEEPRRTVLLEKAIGCYREALQVQTFESNPIDWARIQQRLGLVYHFLENGDLGNTALVQAIDINIVALQVYTRVAFPHEWTQIQRELGDIYQKLSFEEKPLTLSRR